MWRDGVSPSMCGSVYALEGGLSPATISLSVVYEQFVLQRSCVAAGVGALAGELVALWPLSVIAPRSDTSSIDSKIVDFGFQISDYSPASARPATGVTAGYGSCLYTRVWTG